jgi:hypothetical protein
MLPSSAQTTADKGKSDEKIAYIQQMLAELGVVARTEGAEMLCYLLDMAYEEARDVRKRLK